MNLSASVPLWRKKEIKRSWLLYKNEGFELCPTLRYKTLYHAIKIGELKGQEPEIEKMKVWRDKAEITFTPTIFINGYRLPEKYSPDSYRDKN